MLHTQPDTLTLRKRKAVNNRASPPNNIATTLNGMLSMPVTVFDAASATGPLLTLPTAVVTSVVERDSE